ncbi:MAG: hypothetical protein AB7V46_09210 [Thermomicrobiales bacterium]
MVYRATEDVVRRVMPLLDRLAERTIDKARLLQYLSARAGVVWGALELIGEAPTADERGRLVVALTFRDKKSGDISTIVYPSCLDLALDALVQAEYRRLAVARPLSAMDPLLFEALFGDSHCSGCRWQGPGNEQIHRECHYAGHPINFEPVSPA